MSAHFETLLRNACLQQSSSSSADVGANKLMAVMPAKYTQLRSKGPLSKHDSDSVPDRIDGAIAPHFIAGKLIKVHLPDADIRYFSGMYSSEESEYFLKKLLFHTNANNWDKFGKGRSVAQWSRPGGIKYVFSEVEYVAGAFPDFVEKIRVEVMDLLTPIYGQERTNFNYCVCNCYLNGLAGVNWHSDAEPHLVPGCPIACVSFGSERVFSLARMPRTVTESIKSELNLRLEAGSLVVMAGDTQKHYLHAISKEASVKGVRFSLTFRVNFIDLPEICVS